MNCELRASQVYSPVMGHIVRGVQCSLAVLFLLGSTSLLSQQPSPDRTTADDHQNMMAQLGINSLRPGPSGNESAPNHANYGRDESQSIPESARRPDSGKRQEGDNGGRVVEGEAA